MRVLFVNVDKKKAKVEEIKDEKIKGVLDLGIYLHLERYKSYEVSPFNPRNVVVFGTGPLNLPGTNRGVFVFRSPISGVLHASTMGGIGLCLKAAGYDAIVFEGKSDVPVFVAIKESEYAIFEETIPENIFEKEKKMYEILKDFYQDATFRICLVGPAAFNTVYGCVISSIDEENVGKVYDVAGRGGVGSVLAQAHNIVGFSIGGKREVEIKLDPEIIKEESLATKKYRETGTFGGNYPHLKENTIMFNWRIFYLDKEKRLEFYKKYIEEELLKDYKFESYTCKEKCLAVCKKVEKVKIDYEPAEGMGPFIGIFRRDLVQELIHLADSLGFDAIYLGQVLGLVFELIEQGKYEFEKPVIDPEKWDKDYSELNYKIAKELIIKIAKGETPFGKNIRKIAKEFDAKDLTVYVPYGEEYDMTPSYYWTFGLILPVAMHGKYYSDYHTTFKNPEEYAKICAERTLKEYALDNAGICRFHRGWLEEKLNSLLGNGYLENCKYWIKKLLEYRKLANCEPVFWESKRLIDVFGKLIEECANEETKKEFKENPAKFLKEYWERFKKSYDDYFEC